MKNGIKTPSTLGEGWVRGFTTSTIKVIMENLVEHIFQKCSIQM